MLFQPILALGNLDKVRNILVTHFRSYLLILVASRAPQSAKNSNLNFGAKNLDLKLVSDWAAKNFQVWRWLKVGQLRIS